MSEHRTLEAIKYRNVNGPSLEIINQRKLPHETIFEPILGTADGWKAINEMRVRGAPAIAIVGVLSLVIEMHSKTFASVQDVATFVEEQLAYLVTARPTAVNMGEAAKRLTVLAKTLSAAEGATVESVTAPLVTEMELFLERDVRDNKAIGNYGADSILSNTTKDKVTVLTHCNTGSLATAGYGTALGIIRALHERGRLAHAYCTETRPYNQGSRLTAYELVYEGIPGTLIADSMAAALMKEKNVDAVVVGADRVVSNGDTANKIGTYQLAIVAKHHNVPYYVAAPRTSIDMSLPAGDAIVIEERPADELHFVQGQRVSAIGIGAWNPQFDVAPASLITGIVTEVGTVVKGIGKDVFDLTGIFKE